MPGDMILMNAICYLMIAKLPPIAVPSGLISALLVRRIGYLIGLW